MQKAIPNAASPETRLIPLNRLRVDERNVRSEVRGPRAGPGRRRARSPQSSTHGLLENLVVVPRGRTQSTASPRARGA